MLDLVTAAALIAATASFQTRDGVTDGAADGLQQDPQQGATRIPLDRELRVPTEPEAQQRIDPAFEISDAPVQVAPTLVPPAGLPLPDRDPLAIDPATDPNLILVRQADDAARFRATLASAIATNPITDEALAQTAEAEANADLAISSRYPVADFTLSYFGTIARNFSNDPGNLLERSRPSSRADALLRIQQPLINFGASASRVAAERDRVAAAIYGESVAANTVALNAVNAWNSVFGYRSTSI